MGVIHVGGIDGRKVGLELHTDEVPFPVAFTPMFPMDVYEVLVKSNALYGVAGTVAVHTQSKNAELPHVLEPAPKELPIFTLALDVISTGTEELGAVAGDAVVHPLHVLGLSAPVGVEPDQTVLGEDTDNVKGNVNPNVGDGDGVKIPGLDHVHGNE